MYFHGALQTQYLMKKEWFSWLGSRQSSKVVGEYWGGWRCHIWLPPCLLVHQKNSDSEPGKFRPRRVSDNKRKDNRSLLGIKGKQQRQRTCLSCILAEPQTTNSDTSKHPWLSSPAPPLGLLQREHHNTSPHFLLHFWCQSVVWLIRC